MRKLMVLSIMLLFAGLTLASPTQKNVINDSIQYKVKTADVYLDPIPPLLPSPANPIQSPTMNVRTGSEHGINHSIRDQLDFCKEHKEWNFKTKKWRLVAGKTRAECLANWKG